MKKNSKWLALLLAGAMTVSPLSYVNAYAAEADTVTYSAEAEAQVQEENAEVKPVTETPAQDATAAKTTDETKETSAKEESKETNTKNDTKSEKTDADKENKQTDAEVKDAAKEDKKSDAETKDSVKESEIKESEIKESEAESEQETVKENETDVEETAETTEDEIATQADETAVVPVAPTAAITGVTVLKNDGTGYGMFPITDAVYTVKGDQIEISFKTGAKKVFDWLYLGPVTDENKTAQFIGTNTGSTCEFTIQVPLSKRNSWIPVSVGRSDKGTWSTNYLWMSIPNVLVITGQPQGTSCKTGETAVVSVNAAGDALVYQWQYSVDGTTWTDCTGDSAKNASYQFTMAEELAGQYRCVIKDKTDAEVTSNAVEVKFESEKENYSKSDSVSAVYASDDVSSKHNPGDAYTMLKISKSQVIVKGSKLQVAIWVQPASSGSFTYDALYIGHKDDEVKTPTAIGEINEDQSLEKFTFTVPISQAGGEVHFVPRSAKTQKWSTSSSLALKLPALDDFTAPAQISVATQPKSETVTIVGQTVTLSVAASSEDENATFSYQWQFSTDGTNWTGCEGETATQATYTFTMTAQSAGQYRCVITDNEGTSVKSNTAVVREPSTPSVTGATAKVVKEDSTEFSMFKISESSVTKSGNELEVTISTTNTSFDGIYLGSKDDAEKSPVITGTNTKDVWTFTFKVPATYAGQVIPVALRKVKDGTWYVNQYLWMYIPSEGIKDIPTVTDEIKTIAGGTGAVYNDFAITSSKAVLNGDNITLTLNVKGSKWTKLYQGVQADTNKTPVVNGSYDAAADATTFVLNVSSKMQGMNIAVTPGNNTGWFTYARDLFINVPKFSNVANTTADGTYDLYGQAYPTSNYASLNFERGSSVTIKGDTATVTMITQASSYDKLYIGSISDADSVKDAKAVTAQDRSDIASGYKCFVFTIPTSDLGKDIGYVAHVSKTNTWAPKQSTFYINGVLAAAKGDNTDPTPKPDPDPTPKPDPDPTPDPTPGTDAVANGIYSIEVDSSASMFRVIACQLTVKNGKMTAVLTLSGTGYGYLYAGTAAQAAAADKSTWVPFKVNADGKYTYEIPVEALDKGIAVAAYSIKNEKWYDRELIFKSETMKKIGDVDDSSDTPNPTPTPGKDDPNKDDNNQGKDDQNNQTPSGNDGKADNESKYESDTSGSISRVDSSTGLKDGVYTPDRFTWSGGTGKVKISCNKVTIKNGQAYATLVFSSNHYQYVKANGNTYYTTKSGNTATVTIPIALNKNNTILGMTDKMSAAHEIQYSIFVYLAAANTSSNGSDANGGQTVDNTALAEKAPEIMGLEYESETKLEYAEYFKIYHYDQGIVLLEIDMTKDTARDAENNKASDDKSEKSSDAQKTTSDSTNTSADEEMDAADNNGVSEEELAAELYKGNIVNYLLVPEGVEIPVGLEQDMIIVNLPADKTYAASEDILETMKDLDLLDNVAAVGMEKDDCGISEIADKMETKDGEDAEVAFGGLFEQPDLKALVKQETNLALLPAEFLPMDKEAAKDSEADGETTADGSDEAVSESTDPEGDLTVEEQEALFEKVTEKFAMLGIPVIVDRSSQEKTDLAKMEWIKVYGILYGCEDQMNKKFDAAVKAAEK